MSQKTATGEGNLRHVQIEEENALDENGNTLAEGNEQLKETPKIRIKTTSRLQMKCHSI